MKPIVVLQNVLVGGLWYEPQGMVPQMAPDAVADHLVKIGCARAYETKVVDAIEVKKNHLDSPALQPAPVSQEAIAKKRGMRAKRS